MKSKCPRCGQVVIRYRVYARAMIDGKRRWRAIGWICGEGHFELTGHIK